MLENHKVKNLFFYRVLYKTPNNKKKGSKHNCK